MSMWLRDKVGKSKPVAIGAEPTTDIMAKKKTDSTIVDDNCCLCYTNSV